MFVRLIKKPNDHVSIRIVDNVRENGKVKQKTICCVGHFHSSNTTKIELHKKVAQDMIVKMKNELFPALPGMEAILYAPSKKAPPKSVSVNEESINPKTTIEEKRINQGIDDIFGHLYHQLSFDTLLNDSSSAELLKQIVLARIALPSSKLKTCKILERDFNQEYPIHQVYRMMDRLVLQENTVKKLALNATTDLLNQTVNVLFFDVTTLYFESQTSDELRANGFSKDCKFKEVQVVMALVTTAEGLPIWYKEFKGNTSEGSTLTTMVEEMRNELAHVNQITFVADRAMFNKVNLKKLEEMGVKYVVAAKLRTLTKDLKEKILTSNYQPAACEEEFIWGRDFEWEGRRLVVSYSSKRAKKDRKSSELYVL